MLAKTRTSKVSAGASPRGDARCASRRRRAVAAALCVALAFASLAAYGCGSASHEGEYDLNAENQETFRTDQISAQDIEIKDCGATRMANGAVNVAFVAVNPNTEYYARNIPVSIEVEDEAGDSATFQSVIYGMYPEVETGSTAIERNYSIVSKEAKDSSSASSSEAAGADSDEGDNEGAAAEADSAEEAKKYLGKITKCSITPVMSAVTWYKTDFTKEEVERIFTKGAIDVNRVERTVDVTANITGNIKYFDKIQRSTGLDDTLEATAVAIFKDSKGNILFGTENTPVLFQDTALKNKDEVSVDVTLIAEYVPKNLVYADCNLYVTPGL